MFTLPSLNLKGKVSEQEWKVRVDLAACYRLVADMRWGDLIYTHISAKVPDSDHYLVNAFGLGFDEVTASNLVKVDLDGNILDDTPHKINPAGFTIHSAIHEVREDAHCVIHLHTLATIAVASVEGGLKPWSQYSLFSLPSLSYHSYEGLAVDEGEKLRLQQDLGSTNHMLLPNHGGLTIGETVGDAFMRFYDLQRACEIQMALMRTNENVIEIPQPIIDGIYQQAKVVHSGETGGQKAWPAMLRKAYKLDPTFCE
ncbi:class II aldolase/adducin family protein [Alteromonas sp. KUL49]|uniref:class II aldolase/adducin family protein n=1 Tax=Alteromonas sp. KUL49 TaxID=2480798 RepID=UPI00102F06AD|nr:class II aldolase/adducin family protein [Alteromonas sp. KUL49]TAP38952.1 class II aldolase/adducin family protein [Alteromonas sp. KUL49]GEA12392.1 putative aldolase class 2 protein [Alteromonas sp. KUL49]